MTALYRIDFGMAVSLDNFFEKGTTMITSNIGTTPYLSPEVLEQVVFGDRSYYNISSGKTSLPRKARVGLTLDSDPRSCDLFSLGLVLYIMLLGCHPFDRDGDADDYVIAQRMLRGSRADPEDEKIDSNLRRFTFDVHDSIELSENAKDLITRLLEPGKLNIFVLRYETITR